MARFVFGTAPAETSVSSARTDGEPRSAHCSRPTKGSGSGSLVGAVLDAPHDRLGPVALRAHLDGSALDVVSGSAKADLPALIERPGRARVAVERRSDASRIHQQRAVG